MGAGFSPCTTTKKIIARKERKKERERGNIDFIRIMICSKPSARPKWGLVIPSFVYFPWYVRHQPQQCVWPRSALTWVLLSGVGVTGWVCEKVLSCAVPVQVLAPRACCICGLPRTGLPDADLWHLQPSHAEAHSLAPHLCRTPHCCHGGVLYHVTGTWCRHSEFFLSTAKKPVERLGST